MRSSTPKPLHPIAGIPMVTHVIRAASTVEPEAMVVVVSPDLVDIAQRLDMVGRITTAVQEQPLGTGDAMRAALPVIGGAEWLLVFFADHPRLDGETVRLLLDGAVASRAKVTVLTSVVGRATQYGRIDRDDEGRVLRIVESKDDDPSTRTGAVEINSGMMAIDAAWAKAALPHLSPSSTTGEFYLTELIELAVSGSRRPDEPWPVSTVQAEPHVALGINDRVELAAADAAIRQGIRERLMRSGVTLIGPETVFIDEDVTIGADTTVMPFTVLTGATAIGRECVIGPSATIIGSEIGDRVQVRASTIEFSVIGEGSDCGPYAHVRAGTVLAPGVHIGNFAEIKNSELAESVKVGHFSYVGDATVGARTNIGAGTVTANYDGQAKHRTVIGKDAFIGSDTILRAPVSVGDGARTGAGSVVTEDVAPGT
ncbi:MAG: bifunctional UDP-N-acetylglucosamine diphosphorylase/glucosamine-1-phosphate N-acetyltransferase GlmU, partial [Chloroflexota bacterium]